MTDQIPGLMGFVVRALMQEPDLKSGELYERSLARYPAVAEMSVRQFHARYPLQAKREMGRPKPIRKPAPTASAPPAPDQRTGDLLERTLAAAGPREPRPEPAAPATAATPAGVAARPTAADAHASPSEPRRLTRIEAARRPEDDQPRTPPREAVRTLLFRLAMDLETAHSRADLVDVISRLDRYVDEAMSIAR